jgi:hypothetical protein
MQRVSVSFSAEWSKSVEQDVERESEAGKDGEETVLAFLASFGRVSLPEREATAPGQSGAWHACRRECDVASFSREGQERSDTMIGRVGGECAAHRNRLSVRLSAERTAEAFHGAQKNAMVDCREKSARAAKRRAGVAGRPPPMF